jgi:multisubunit Na+/H+ antiporter MnhC subunit
MSQEKLESAKNLFFIVLGIDMLVTALVAITDLWAVGVLNDIRSGVTTVDQSTINTLEFWESFAKVMILTLICVGLALVRWLDACYEYARKILKATGFLHEGWKTWGWIVPFMNLFKPYQVIGEIYKAGNTDFLGGEEWKKSSGSGMLLVWWILWVITHMVMGAIGKQALKKAMKNSFEADLTLNQIIGMYYTSITVCVVSLIIAGLWFVVAGNLTRRLLNRSVAGKAVKPQRASISLPPSTPTVTYSTSPLPPPAPTRLPPNEIPEMEDTEDRIYAQVGGEIETGNTDKATWTRAFSQAGGDDKQTRVLYIQLRVPKLLALEEEQRKVRQDEQQAEAAEKSRIDLLTLKENISSGKISREDADREVGWMKSDFFLAIRNSQSEVVERMVKEHPYLLAARNTYGETGLHIAARESKSVCIRLLAEHGSYIKARNNEGYTAMEVANNQGCPAAAAVLASL